MKQKRTSKLAIVLLVILSVVVMYGLPIGLGIWMALSDGYHYEEKNGEFIIDEGDLVINSLSSYYAEEESEFYVEGVLKNNSDETCEYITITFSVYDTDNNVIGEAETYLTKLEENETWKFKAKYYGIDAKEASGYKFSSIDFY